MSDFTLYVGSQNISSWSLRAWLMLKHADINFETVVIELNQPVSKQNLSKISPSAKVPVLKHKTQLIWDSLAIGEYLSEIFPEKNYWPLDLNARTFARSICCEMHSGFSALRQHLPFEVNARFNHHLIPPNAALDIQRIIQIWEQCRQAFHGKGPFLFGNFTIADAMFAPVAIRFRTYAIKLSQIASDYMNTILELPSMKEWNSPYYSS
jgi:glutathione S-transferase